MNTMTSDEVAYTQLRIHDTIKVITDFDDDLRTSSSEKVHYLDPENDEDDEKFLLMKPTSQFENGKRLCKKLDKVDMITDIVYERPVIYNDVLVKWLCKLEKDEKICKKCGREKWHPGFIKWDGEFKYLTCDPMDCQ